MPADPTVPHSPGAQISPDGPTVPVAELVAPKPEDEQTLPLHNPQSAVTVATPLSSSTAQTVATPREPTAATTPLPAPTQPATKPAAPKPAATKPAAAVKPAAATKPAEPAKPPKPETWSARVAVPGAVGPGQKKAPAPTAPTQKMARVAEPTPTVVARPAPQPTPRPAAPRPAAPRRRRRSGFRRFLGAVLALLLLLAVPVVSAYVAYKLASGENPFDWPPAVDLSRVF